MQDLTKWSVDYETLKNEITRVRVKGANLTEEQYQHLLKECADLQMSLKRLNSTNCIPSSELARREVLMSNLEGIVRKSRTPAKTLTADSSTFNPMELSSHGLILQKQETIQMQDRMIEEIGSGVMRLQQQAIDIGEESKLQNSLLDAFHDNVDESAENLRDEAKHAETVRKTTRVCYLYICIGVEVLILTVLGIVWLNHGK